MSSWGFPLTSQDLKELVKGYLDAKGVESKIFKNNMPGYEFVRGFIKRHPRIVFRSANLIKRSRAKVSREEITQFITNFSKTAHGVPATNIFNYDETNFQDDPGKQKALFKKGVKYAEEIKNSTKTSISVMFCGSASGQLLPPYVVYRGEHVMDTWRTRGPKGARFNAKKRGWFDSAMFKDCLDEVFIPALQKLPSKKVLTGDNLSSPLRKQ